ncbi:DUF1971 domain-containing protein [Ensifer sp. MJa1]|uniref:DUF1971 domain-containing protein n=1 Tax=Ensifer sp. MJa1 TaxID=2919888 RepID=UPI003008B6DC
MKTRAITDAEIRLVVDRFYTDVRGDSSLNAAFAAVTDWDDHLQRMTEFWSSMLLATGRYKGNPVAMHLIHTASIRPEMFKRWLALWHKATSEALPSDIAGELQLKAARIASRLSSALFGPESVDLRSVHPVPVSQPFRSTPVFNEHTIPAPLRQAHSLRPGAWAKLSVLEGVLKYCLPPQPAAELAAATSVVIPPELAHHLEIVGPVRCQLHFYDHEPTTA